MASNKLYITISDKRLGEGDSNTPSSPSSANYSEREANSITKEDSLIKRYAEHELFHLVKSSAKTSVNFAISNIGNMTGDYITQRKVQMTKQSLDGAVSIGFTTLAGAKYGPIGAAIGFAAGVIGQGVQSYYEDKANRIEIAKTNYEIEQLRKKVGLNTTLDGSRGTEN